MAACSKVLAMHASGTKQDALLTIVCLSKHVFCWLQTEAACCTHLLRVYIYSKVVYADPECRTETTQAKEAAPSSHKVLASLSTCGRSSAKLAWKSASCCSTCDAAGPDKTPLAGVKSAVESKEFCG